jgi:hypothetical protein
VALAEPVPPDSVPADPALAEPVPPDPAVAEPVLADPLLASPGLAAGGVLSAALELASPEAGELDVGVTGVEELPLTGVVAVAVTSGLAVLGGWAELGWQRVPVALAVCSPPVALVLALAETVVLALPVAVEVALAGPVGVAGPVGGAVALFPEPPLALSAGELLAGSAGDAAGPADLADVADVAPVDDAELGGHAGTCTPLWAAEELPGLTPPVDAPPWVPDPVRLGTPPPVLGLGLGVELELENPTAVPIETKAPRSGGTARATPMANTTQAAARAGRSSPYRQSRCCRSPAPSPSCPPRAAFQRRTMSARNPPLAAACLLA